MIPLGLLSGWRLYLLIGALVALLALVWTIYGWKRDAAKLAEAREIAERVEKEREAAEKKLLADLESERARSDQFAALAQRLGGQLASVSARRTQVREEISALPPDRLEPRIKADLALRRPDDLTPGFYNQELEAIAQAVAAYPQFIEQEKLFGKRLSVLEQQIGSQQKQIVLLEDGYDTLKGHYATLYNSIGVKKRSPKCLYLWRCGTRTLPTPAPDELVTQP